MRFERYCRNCLSENTVISLNGLISPFFAMRVHREEQIESVGEAMMRIINAPVGLKKNMAAFLFKLIKALPKSGRLLDFRPMQKINIRICKDCGFIGPNEAYSFRDLLPLYIDYRPDKYNLDRCAVEPVYAEIKDIVGKSKEEMECRLSNIDHLIDTLTDSKKINTVLDWGGGEGKFIPRRLQNKAVTILDVSNEPLISQKYSRLNDLPEDSKFDYLQLCHVLEHVSEPFNLMKKVLSHVSDGGIVYIEVPQDRTDVEMNKFLDEPCGIWHILHEHINLYHIHSIEMLGKAIGLKKLHVGSNLFDLGWCKATVVSGVFIKPA